MKIVTKGTKRREKKHQRREEKSIKQSRTKKQEDVKEEKYIREKTHYETGSTEEREREIQERTEEKTHT